MYNRNPGVQRIKIQMQIEMQIQNVDPDADPDADPDTSPGTDPDHTSDTELRIARSSTGTCSWPHVVARCFP